MKSYTDIEQSKKLAEFLPLESADMWYWEWPTAPEYNNYEHPMFHRGDDIVNVPCWSLAALLEILPSYLGEYKDGIDFGLSKSVNGKWYSAHYLKTSDEGDLSAVYVKTGDTPVDACYEMILTLKEFGLI